jgi:protein TonB
MKPELILRSDLLDLIFENRNKDYGAYLLRKEYPRRLMMAMAGTSVLILLFVLLMAARPAKKPVPAPEGIMVTFCPVDILPDQPIPDPPPASRPQAPVVNAGPPVFTPDPVDKPIATQNEMSNAQLGTITDTGLVENSGGHTPVAGPVEQAAPPVAPAPGPADDQPLEHADIMPSFNGDLQRFMLRHLRPGMTWRRKCCASYAKCPDGGPVYRAAKRSRYILISRCYL